MTGTESQLLDKTITHAHEDYLKAIYVLASEEGKVTNSSLANHLEVTPASTTHMVKRLAELDLVVYEPYQEITLTAAGNRVALEVLRHHRLLELYLHTKLHLPWDQVHDEAERLEHVISEALEDAIAAALGDPTVDPHGDPIPSKDGRIEPVTGVPLVVAEIDVPYRLVRVLPQDNERLIYLASLGLTPGAWITVRRRTPFAGPLLVDVAGAQHPLAHEMAERLIAVPAVS